MLSILYNDYSPLNLSDNPPLKRDTLKII